MQAEVGTHPDPVAAFTHACVTEATARANARADELRAARAESPEAAAAVAARHQAAAKRARQSVARQCNVLERRRPRLERRVRRLEAALLDLPTTQRMDTIIRAVPRPQACRAPRSSRRSSSARRTTQTAEPPSTGEDDPARMTPQLKHVVRATPQVRSSCGDRRPLEVRGRVGIPGGVSSLPGPGRCAMSDNEIFGFPGPIEQVAEDFSGAIHAEVRQAVHDAFNEIRQDLTKLARTAQ